MGVFPVRHLRDRRLLESSPRAWGCFRSTMLCLFPSAVFPTCVGVFPKYPPVPSVVDSLPHVRGGVSAVATLAQPMPSSSPRAWGCFYKRGRMARPRPVFPTCVGVFLPLKLVERGSTRLPHVRGGVSFTMLKQHITQMVFPTCVGVFLSLLTNRTVRIRLPHVRGGVSKLTSPCIIGA